MRQSQEIMSSLGFVMVTEAPACEDADIDYNIGVCQRARGSPDAILFRRGDILVEVDIVDQEHEVGFMIASPTFHLQHVSFPGEGEYIPFERLSDPDVIQNIAETVQSIDAPLA